MRAFQPYASLEQYIGRRLLALLAALALTDIAIVLSTSLSTALMSTASGVDVIRARAIEILNDKGQPVLVATADERQNGVFVGRGWQGTGRGQPQCRRGRSRLARGRHGYWCAAGLDCKQRPRGRRVAGVQCGGRAVGVPRRERGRQRSLGAAKCGR